MLIVRKALPSVLDTQQKSSILYKPFLSRLLTLQFLLDTIGDFFGLIQKHDASQNIYHICHELESVIEKLKICPEKIESFIDNELANIFFEKYLP